MGEGGAPRMRDHRARLFIPVILNIGKDISILVQQPSGPPAYDPPYPSVPTADARCTEKHLARSRIGSAAGSRAIFPGRARIRPKLPFPEV